MVNVRVKFRWTVSSSVSSSVQSSVQDMSRRMYSARRINGEVNSTYQDFFHKGYRTYRALWSSHQLKTLRGGCGSLHYSRTLFTSKRNIKLEPGQIGKSTMCSCGLRRTDERRGHAGAQI